jgi:hypothetical protein
MDPRTASTYLGSWLTNLITLEPGRMSASTDDRLGRRPPTRPRSSTATAGLHATGGQAVMASPRQITPHAAINAPRLERRLPESRLIDEIVATETDICYPPPRLSTEPGQRCQLNRFSASVSARLSSSMVTIGKYTWTGPRSMLMSPGRRPSDGIWPAKSNTIPNPAIARPIATSARPMSPIICDKHLRLITICRE